MYVSKHYFNPDVFIDILKIEINSIQSELCSLKNNSFLHLPKVS